jgi:hypothetical protein
MSHVRGTYGGRPNREKRYVTVEEIRRERK